MSRILIIAHAPLASALRASALHVFADAASDVAALDVMPDAAPEHTLGQARVALRALRGGASGGDAGAEPVLVLSDLFGATPCNVARQLADEAEVKLLAGVNLPMLLRAVHYRAEPLAQLVARAALGGTQGVMQVAPAS